VRKVWLIMNGDQEE